MTMTKGELDDLARICLRCNGAGFVTRLEEYAGDEWWLTDDCQDCLGTGLIEAKARGDD